MISVYLKTPTLFGCIELFSIENYETKRVSMRTLTSTMVLDLYRIPNLENTSVKIWLYSDSYLCDIQLNDDEPFKGILVLQDKDTSICRYTVHKLLPQK